MPLPSLVVLLFVFVLDTKAANIPKAMVLLRQGVTSVSMMR